MRFALINVEAFVEGIMPVVVVTDVRIEPDRVKVIGEKIETKMLEITSSMGIKVPRDSEGNIPFVHPIDEPGGKLWIVNVEVFGALSGLFETLAWVEIRGKNDEPNK